MAHLINFIFILFNHKFHVRNIPGLVPKLCKFWTLILDRLPSRGLHALNNFPFGNVLRGKNIVKSTRGAREH